MRARGCSSGPTKITEFRKYNRVVYALADGAASHRKTEKTVFCHWRAAAAIGARSAMRCSGHKASAAWCEAVFAAAWLAGTGIALADAPIEIGRTIFVVNDVQGRMGEAEPQRITLNENVLYEEDIITADKAETIMEFRDGSTFQVGPGAVVRIDSFVFNPEESVSRKAVTVGRGVFRYVSGIAANEQETKVSTGNGVLAVRGSVVSGIVDPEVPAFFHVGEGAAVFTNDAGSMEMRPGHAIAVPSRTTPVMRPDAMPPAVAAQALQAIERRLPPREVLRNRPPPTEAWLRRAGAANLLPVAEQARALNAAAGPRPLSGASGPSPIARELGLLNEGHRRNLFNGAQTVRTPDQQAFIAQAARTVPGAPAVLTRSTALASSLHQSARLAGTKIVIHGITKAAPSPEVLTQVASAAVRADPTAAPIITQTATAAYQGPDRARLAAQLGKATAEAKKTPPRSAIPVSAPVPAPPAPRQAGLDRPEARKPGQPALPPGQARKGMPAPTQVPPRQEAEHRPPAGPQPPGLGRPGSPPPQRPTAVRPPMQPAAARSPVAPPPQRPAAAVRQPPRPPAAVRPQLPAKQPPKPPPLKKRPPNQPAATQPGTPLPR
jgi:fructose-specific component phosphotransferase system IIB-like protein